MFSKKKGQTFLDLLIFILVLFAMGIAALFGNMIVNNLNDEIQADTDMHAEAQASSQTVTTNYPGMFDKAFLLVLVLFWILLIVSSFMIDTHPIFFAIMIILLVFTFVIGMVLSNAYEEVTDDPDLVAYSVDFPITNWVFDHFLLVLIVVGFSTGTALYAKNKV